MRVANLTKSWDSHLRPKGWRLPYKLFLASIAMGIVIAVGIITLENRQYLLKKPVAYISQSTQAKAAATQRTVSLPEPHASFGIAMAQRLALPPPTNLDCASMPCIALTFDDGPDSIDTPKVLDALDAEGVKATFFLIGNRVAANAAVVRRIAGEGHEIGNHSWSHPDFTKLNAQQIQDQVSGAQNAITALGLPPPQLFRPPYEDRNGFVLSHVHMPVILWNVDPKDWHEKDPNKIVQIVTSEARPGAIILMHSTKDATAAAVSQIIKNLKPNFHLVTVTQLLDLTPTSSGQFFSR